MPDGQLAATLPDGVVNDVLADGVSDPKITRPMGLVPVNALKVTSVVSHSPDSEDEFLVTRLSISRPDRTSECPDDRDSKDRGEALYIARC